MSNPLVHVVMPDAEQIEVSVYAEFGVDRSDIASALVRGLAPSAEKAVSATAVSKVMHEAVKVAERSKTFIKGRAAASEVASTSNSTPVLPPQENPDQLPSRDRPPRGLTLEQRLARLAADLHEWGIDQPFDENPRPSDLVEAAVTTALSDLEGRELLSFDRGGAAL